MLLKTLQFTLLLLFTLLTTLVSAQTATIKGLVFDENNKPISGVNVVAGDSGTLTTFEGAYILEIPSNQDVTVVFSYIGFKDARLTLNLKSNEDFEFNPTLSVSIEQIGVVEIDIKKRKRIEGITSLTPETIRRIPGANAGVENVLQSFGGVNANNELSTQYAVRGGNYDENLVYVNEIEVDNKKD